MSWLRLKTQTKKGYCESLTFSNHDNTLQPEAQDVQENKIERILTYT